MAVYNCPVCDGKFEPADKVGSKKNKCPHCEAELKAIRSYDRDNRKIQYDYIVADPDAKSVKTAIAKTQPKEKPTNPHEAEGAKLVSNPGEIPEIWKYPQREVKGKMRNYYVVEYKGIIHMDWVYCSHCWKKLFQNRTIDTGFSSDQQLYPEMMCKSCGSINQFVFMSKAARY